MYLFHQSQLPYSYYDADEKKIIIKLTTDSNIKEAKLIYGDPFQYEKTEKTDANGNNIWEWMGTEAFMQPQYTAKKRIHWRFALSPLKTRRLKYRFSVIGKNGAETVYGEDGAGETESYFFFPFVHEVDALRVPAWASETCWYQIFPERFRNGDPSLSPAVTEDWETGIPKQKSFFGGDLRGIIEKLPYIQALGINGIYLTPIFRSPSNHKYDTADYFSVDPHFGDTQTLKELVEKAHKRGIKVMLDAVFNHIGVQHPFWKDVIKNQCKSKYKDYFHIHGFPVKEAYPARDALNYDAFAFVPGMPKWNTENPEARRYLIDVALHWIKECDIDGWRLDVSDEVSFSFWRAMREAVDACKPGFYLLGEVWHDPSKWLNGRYFDAVMNYPLGYNLRDLFFTRKISPDAFNEKLMAKLSVFSDIHNRVRFNLMDSHDTARALSQAGGDKNALKNAFLFLVFMKGAPCIYYGTEVGMEGGPEPGSRGPMLWDEGKQDVELTAFFKSLIALRKKYNSLIQNADLFYSREKGLCHWKLNKGSDTLTIVYNPGGKRVKLNGEILLSTYGGDTTHLPPNACALVK
jgi:neopullulanase